MAQIIQKISVEVSKPNFFQAIVAKQFDSGTRFVKATFIHNNEKVYIEPTATVTINATRCDGSKDSFAGEVNDDGTATLPLTYWMLELVGTVKCDISVLSGDSRLTSTSFDLEVEKASNNSGDVSEDESCDVLLSLIERVEAIENTDLHNALKTYFINIQTLLPQLAYATEDNIGNTLIQNAQDIVDVLENDAEEPETPTDKTLVSISATYTGGNVTVGKDVSSLTGVTVTAIYSDGSTSDITNYTLSGEIAEGENTITVTYEGLTTTFVVIGEEVATDENKINVYRGFIGQDSTSTSEPTTNASYPNAVGSSVITMPEVEGTSSFTYEIQLNSNITDVTVINWKIYDAGGVRVASQNGLNPMSLSDKTRSVRLSLLNQKATADGSDAVITGFTITVKIGSTVKSVFEYGINDLRG